MNFFKRFTIVSFSLPIDVILGKTGLYAAQVHPSASIFWPVVGFDLALILTFGYWLLPLVFTGAFLYNLLTFGSLITCFTIAIANTLKVFVAAKVFNRRHIRENFLRFIFACLIAAVVGGTLGTGALVLDKLDIYHTSIANINSEILRDWTAGDTGGFLVFIVWLNWVLGDFLGMLAFTPAIQFLFKLLNIKQSNGNAG
jgi:hypothetical protein